MNVKNAEITCVGSVSIGARFAKTNGDGRGRGKWLSEKAQGPDDRPIGIQSSYVRLWENIRIHEVKAWASAQHRDYDWACAGASSEAAVFAGAIGDDGICSAYA